jgi:hypothetical protein
MEFRDLQKKSHETSVDTPAFAWLVNVGVFCCALLVVIMAWQYTDGRLTYWTVLLALGGIAAVLITAMLALIWLGGIDALSRRRAGPG